MEADDVSTIQPRLDHLGAEMASLLLSRGKEVIKPEERCNFSRALLTIKALVSRPRPAKFINPHAPAVVPHQEDRPATLWTAHVNCTF